MIYGLPWKRVFGHSWGVSPIIFTHDCASREIYWRILPFVTKQYRYSRQSIYFSIFPPPWQTFRCKHWHLGAYYITDFPSAALKGQISGLWFFFVVKPALIMFRGIGCFGGSHISLRNAYCHKFVKIIHHKCMYLLEKYFPILKFACDSQLPANWAGISKLSSDVDFWKSQSDW